MRREDAVSEALRGLGGDPWPGIGAEEAEHRLSVLAGIADRLAEGGPHRARDCAERGRLFAPFAALQGLDEVLAEAEREDG